MRATRSIVPLTAVAFLAVFLSGCGPIASDASGGKPSAGQASVQSVASAGNTSNTPSMQPSTQPATRPTSTAVATSAGPARPARDGDVDGDGRPDQVTLSAGGALAVHYSGGGSDVVNLGPGIAGDQKLLGTADADGDGHAEVFVRMIMGASAQIDTVLRYVDGHLRQLTMDGEQAHLSYGASVRNQFTWACQPPTAAIVQASSTSNDNDQSFQGEVRRYRFAGSTMVLISRQAFSIRANAPIPGMRAVPGCGSLVLAP